MLNDNPNPSYLSTLLKFEINVLRENAILSYYNLTIYNNTNFNNSQTSKANYTFHSFTHF